ncbi:MAG: hypothetical protein COB15_08610 [Flavobacteriales bacterium]|nr:MAG: hypothetical protein COB15_08610 [Flavobacteriales bacterium]
MSNTFKNYLIQKGLANNTVESIYGDVIPFINWCEEENIEAEQSTYTEILAYIKYIQKRGIKQRTVQVYVSSIKHYFSWIVKRELRAENPVRQVDIKGVKRQYLYDILKKQELETLYENFEITEENNKAKNQNWYKASLLTSRRNKVILGLMIWQGLGARELAKLEVKDLKLREGKVYIQGSRRSNERELKLESHQILDVMEYTLQTRQEMIKLSNVQSELLFIGIGGGNHFSNMMQQLLKKLNKQNARIENVKQIRASVITNWLQHYNLREVQYRAGHRYVSSTEAYLVNDLEGLQEDITKFHPIG